MINIIIFSIVDESGDGKINKAEMKKFLQFVNETQGLGKNDKEVDAINDEIFTTLGKTELTLDDVRDVVAARWGAWVAWPNAKFALQIFFIFPVLTQIYITAD